MALRATITRERAHQVQKARSCVACGRAAPAVRPTPTQPQSHTRKWCQDLSTASVHKLVDDTRKTLYSTRKSDVCPKIRQQGQPNGVQSPRNPATASTCGARDSPALHRMPERVSSPAVKGSLRRCAPLTAHAPPIRHPVPEMPCLARARKPECVSREICNNAGAASEFSCCKRLIRLGKVARFREKRVRWAIYSKRSDRVGGWHQHLCIRGWEPIIGDRLHGVGERLPKTTSRATRY